MTLFVGLPSYQHISVFVAMTFLIWVSEPLLSLVNSASMGRYAGKSTSSDSSNVSWPAVKTGTFSASPWL